MYVITVIPIKKGISKETLSYISSHRLEIGSVIEIPLRKHEEKGLVLNCERAENQKAEIKDLPFELRKISGSEGVRLFRPTLIKSLNEISEHFAAPMGSLLAQAVKKEIFEETLFLQKQPEIKPEVFESFAIQNQTSERHEIYRSLIRENFAKNKSVFFAAHTEESARQTYEALKRGIEKYSILELFKSSKSFSASLRSIAKTDHPILLVGTADLLPIIPSNTGAIIVDEESSRFFRKRTRPFLDSRALLESFAKTARIRIFFGALLLRPETHLRISKNEIDEYGYISGKINHPVKTLIVDLRKTSQYESEKEKTFKIFSDELSEMIKYAAKKNKKMFVFGARRGIAPQTLCLDCGNVVQCSQCESPVVLHKKIIEGAAHYSFICHHCGKKRDAMEKCAFCGSWRLEAFGIGTLRIAQEIEKLTGQAPLVLDSDNAKTAAQAARIIENFEKRGGFLVGTEMVFEYLKEESVDYAAIASIDSLFSIPDFRANEHIMQVILKTKLLVKENILIQGRNAGESIIETGLQSDIGKFIKEELAARKNFSYPPFQTFIKISISASKDRVKKDIEILSKLLSKWTPSVFPAFIKTKKGNTVANILISLPTAKWPDSELRQILLSLPPYIEVKVNPESLL